MPAPIRKFKVNFPKGWREIATKCKVMEFLNRDEGKKITTDFYVKLKQCDGSRFPQAFEDAVDHLMNQSDSFWLINSVSLKKAYQSLENEVLESLNNHISRVESIKIVGICIFWTLHQQNVEV